MVENMYKDSHSISVCIATFNGEVYIREQLDSILIQLGQNDEVIISDDLSTDTTLDIVRDYKDPRIKILSTNKRLGTVLNFEQALASSQGEIIFLCDQDDIWELNKVSKSLIELETCDLLVSDCFIIDSRNTIICNSYFLKRNSGPGLLKNIYKNTYLGCCMVFRRKILKFALPFPSQVNMHDEWIGLIAQVFFHIKFTSEKLIRYRRHGKNASPELNKSCFSWQKRIWIRLYKLAHLIWRYLLFLIHSSFKTTQN